MLQNYLNALKREDMLEIILVLEKYSDLDSPIQDEDSLIDLACKYNNIYIVKHLISMGANILGKEKLLYISVQNDNVDMLLYLLSLNLDPNIIQDEMYEDTLLITCAFYNNTQCLPELLKLNLNMDYASKEDGSTALHIFSYHQNHSCIKQLLDAGARTDILNDVGTCVADYTILK